MKDVILSIEDFNYKHLHSAKYNKQNETMNYLTINKSYFQHLKAPGQLVPDKRRYLKNYEPR